MACSDLELVFVELLPYLMWRTIFAESCRAKTLWWSPTRNGYELMLEADSHWKRWDVYSAISFAASHFWRGPDVPLLLLFV